MKTLMKTLSILCILVFAAISVIPIPIAQASEGKLLAVLICGSGDLNDEACALYDVLVENYLPDEDIYLLNVESTLK